MRKMLTIVTILLTLPAWASKPVTRGQLDQLLTSAHGRTDADMARQIADLRLTERLSPARLAAMQSQLPGDKSRQALLALADESAFLAPSAAEILPKAAPDLPEQRRMLGLVVAYVGKTIPQLPNFLATRVTAHFADTPLVQAPDGEFIPLRSFALHRC